MRPVNGYFVAKYNTVMGPIGVEFALYIVALILS